MQRARLIALAAVAVTAAITATTSTAATQRHERPQSAGSPVAFLAQIVRLLAANQYADAWRSLNPLQQASAPQQAYVACEAQSPIPGQLTSLRMLHVRHEQVRVVPEQAPVASTGVTFALRFASAGSLSQGVRIVLTAHAVAVGSHWTWILPQARLQLFRQGCGTDL